MFRTSSLDKTLDVACSHLRLEPDWPSILLICDLIRQNDTTPKYAIQAVKKKLMSPNPHTAYYALLCLESVVKNCGSPIHDEIATRENCEAFSQLIEQTPHENVKAKMLELIQAWAFAFRSNDKYTAIKDTMTILKTKGHQFPELKEADAMFTSDTAPTWQDGNVCHRCRVEFSFTQRKHHCRHCGQIFCAQCSSKTCTLPKFGIEKEVRVCDGCFAELQKPAGVAGVKRSEGPNDLPAEYLNSSLAQQSQTPPRKSEQELKEEEELQLALALSQSEAEIKNKKPTSVYRMSTTRKTSSPEAVNSVSPIAPSLRDSSPASISSAFDDRSTDPELAKYLNRDYWEQRGNKTTNSQMQSNNIITNPTAPISTPQPSAYNSPPSFNTATEDAEIDQFVTNVRTQVEIFVNRMKSNSSRGRSISNDSSVQNLFLNLTACHSRLLEYIKKADDKRMWYEQLQDKLTQIKDSRAALDVLRQEHQEKLRQQAEEQERQRQMQMAYKLELMRKKKQEYLQYQRQLALQRIQEQEREMKLHQDQQKVMYSMGMQSPYLPQSGPFMGQPPQQQQLPPQMHAQHLPGQQLQQPVGPGGPISMAQHARSMGNDTSPAHGMPPMNSYAAAGPMSIGANGQFVPSPQMQRYSIPSQQPLYSSVTGQPTPNAMMTAGMHSMPQQYMPNMTQQPPNMAMGIPNQAFPQGQLPPGHVQQQQPQQQQQQPQGQGQPDPTAQIPIPYAQHQQPIPHHNHQHLPQQQQQQPQIQQQQPQQLPQMQPPPQQQLPPQQQQLQQPQPTQPLSQQMQQPDQHYQHQMMPNHQMIPNGMPMSPPPAQVSAPAPPQSVTTVIPAPIEEKEPVQEVRPVVAEAELISFD